MEPILNEFISDLERVKGVLLLTDLIKQFSFTEKPNIDEALLKESYFTSAHKLYNHGRGSHTGIAILPGTMLLYLAGRFENYVKTIFEELCSIIAIKCCTFQNLPRTMKESILKFTTEVIANPRKYGHAENGVATFIKHLNENINENSVSNINSQCLSITYENMRSDTLNDLFERIGAKNIWDSIGQQTSMKKYFITHDPNQAKSEAIKFLNELMNLRNKIAHPSGNFSWPNTDTVIKQIEYLDGLAKGIHDYSIIYDIKIANVVKEKIAVNS